MQESWEIEMISEKGEKFKLLNVLYLPSVKRNLLSTNRFTQKGVELFANNKRVLIKKRKFEITLPAIVVCVILERSCYV